VLYGRGVELAEIERLLVGARQGRSAALVVRGEAGIGKSALLAAAAAADDTRVLRAVGVESELELPFAALHLLLRPALERAPALPAPQAAAIRGVFGLTEAGGVDRFLVGVAVLGLLAELAADGPLLCLVDDAQWLDRASAEALVFAARRLDAEGVVMLFAARDDDGRFDAPGLPELRLRGLGDADAAAVLEPHRLSPLIRDRIIEEATGNPLALVELPAALAPGQRDGDPGPVVLQVGASNPAGRVQVEFGRRIGRLPEPTQALLLVAAAEDTGDLAVVLRAGELLGAHLPDLDPAERAGLVRVEAAVVGFGHPLARAAAYRGATVGRRLAAHRALAAVLDDQAGADRRAWHLAVAATGPDEAVAAALERSAERAHRRAGYAAVAALHERSARLTPDGTRRARRLAAAAHAAVEAGQLRRAKDLAVRAASGSDDPAMLADLARIRAGVEFEQGSPRTATQLLLDGATAVGQSPAVAAALLVEAGLASWFIGGPRLADRAVAKLPADSLPAGSRLAPFVRGLRGLSRFQAGELADALPLLREAVDGLRGAGLDIQGMLMAGSICLAAAEYAACEELVGAAVTRCRQDGVIGRLPLALQILGVAQTLGRGRHGEAAAGLEEALQLALDTGQHRVASQIQCSLALIAAFGGDEQRCRTLAEDGIRAATAHDNPGVAAVGGWAVGLLDLGLGHHQDALARLEATAGQGTPIAVFCAADLVEAAVRAGQPERAGEALSRVEEWAASSRLPTIRAAALRCRALLSPGPEAGEQFAAAADLAAQADQPYERARTELLYGGWLRRARRRADARSHLRTALDLFDRVGASPWADRARAELRAAGETPTPRESGTDVLSRLTPQERRVVRRAATGASNRTIAAELFLSHRTVGYHLYKAFPKLGIASRAELASLAVDWPAPDQDR
jgi:DNA-binding CsgD family transcriptional regulator/tetratricopeptide (TPR) repeat protein